MKNVLITGACGYLGARLSDYLAKKGYSITAFDSFNPYKYSKWTSLMKEVIVGDIRDEAILSNFAEKHFDMVIHLISLDHNKSEDNPNYVSSINVMPTWNLLDKLTKYGLEKFIYFSTIHVYGRIPNKIITEEHFPRPLNAYGLTHLLSENICNYFNSKTDTKCINVRLSNSYGSPVFKENNCWQLVVNDFCKSAFLKKKIKLVSDGSPQKDFIHISDICNMVQLLVEAKCDCFKGNVFHGASGNTLSILEIAHIIKEVYRDRFGKEATVLFPDDSISNSPHNLKNNEKYRFDTSKVKSLGFKARMDLSTGINEIFEYLMGFHV